MSAKRVSSKMPQTEVPHRSFKERVRCLALPYLLKSKTSLRTIFTLNYLMLAAMTLENQLTSKTQSYSKKTYLSAMLKTLMF